MFSVSLALFVSLLKAGAVKQANSPFQLIAVLCVVALPGSPGGPVQFNPPHPTCMNKHLFVPTRHTSLCGCCCWLVNVVGFQVL